MTKNKKHTQDSHGLTEAAPLRSSDSGHYVVGGLMEKD